MLWVLATVAIGVLLTGWFLYWGIKGRGFFGGLSMALAIIGVLGLFWVGSVAVGAVKDAGGGNYDYPPPAAWTQSCDGVVQHADPRVRFPWGYVGYDADKLRQVQRNYPDCVDEWHARWGYQS